MDSLSWVAENIQSLMVQFGDEWIAVQDGVVVAHAKDCALLMPMLAGKGRSFITFVPKEYALQDYAYSCRVIERGA